MADTMIPRNWRWPTKYSRWLKKRKTEDTPIGDLARDAINDNKWPAKSNDFFAFLSHLKDMHACDAAIEALVDSWIEYNGIDYSKVLNKVEYFDREDFHVVTLANNQNISPGIYIYVLYHEYDDEKCYIGITKNPIRRLKDHLFNTHNKELSNWINSLLIDGMYPLMVILDIVKDKSTALIYERLYIGAFQYIGFSLLNRNKR